MQPEWIDVESSNIDAIAYEADKSVLHVRFKSGSHYTYTEVGETSFERFKQADSKGRFFAQFIRGFYPYEKVEG